MWQCFLLKFPSFYYICQSQTSRPNTKSHIQIQRIRNLIWLALWATSRMKHKKWKMWVYTLHIRLSSLLGESHAFILLSGPTSCYLVIWPNFTPIFWKHFSHYQTCKKSPSEIRNTTHSSHGDQLQPNCLTLLHMVFQKWGAPLNLVIRWCHLHWFQSCPPGCIATLLWIALLAL